MKRIFRSQSILLLSMLFMASVMFTSCGSDSDPKNPPPPPPNAEGFYVYGTNTVATLPTDDGARMVKALLDPSKEPKITSKDGVYGKFMYIGANSTITFVQVDAEMKAITFGSDDQEVKLGTDIGGFPINDMVVYGTLKKNGDPILVEDEGLYYTWVDTNTGTVVVAPIKAQMIGDATEGQWATGTALPMISTTKEKTVFEKTNVNLKGSTGYRYRMNDGWHISDIAGQVTLSSLGVESYGEAWDSGINDVGFYLDNIPHKNDGVFTVRLEYDAALEKWTETKTKTGDLLIDYTNKKMGLFGNAYTLPSGAEGAWKSGEDGYGLHNPTKDATGKIYTWTWNDAVLIEGREFIFLQDGAWGGVQIDFTQATNGGAAITNNEIKDATAAGKEYHNYYVATGGTYDLTLVINATTNIKTVTIVKN